MALQLRNLQVLGEIAVEKNSTIVFPAQFLDSTRALAQFISLEIGQRETEHPVPGGSFQEFETVRRPVTSASAP